jgi:hypothetical protein
VKNPVSKFAFQMRPAALHRGGGVQAGRRHRQAARGAQALRAPRHARRGFLGRVGALNPKP